jgi:pyruvate,water dikinase
MPTEPLRALFAFSSVQGVLDPLTPLGRDTIRLILLSVGRIFGARLTLETQDVLWEAGERLWIDLTGLTRTRAGRRILSALSYVDPDASRAMRTLIEEGAFPPPRALRPRVAGQLLRVNVPTPARALHALLWPNAARARMLRLLEGMLAEAEARFERAHDLAARLVAMRESLDRAFAFALPHFVPRFGMGMATFNLLQGLASTVPEETIDARVMMRGVDHNVTTEMDLALWETAQAIRADPTSLACVRARDPEALAETYLGRRLPSAAQAALDAFLARYGMRGLAEIDVGRPRWREEPQPILQTVQSYLSLTDPNLAPDVVHARGADEARAEIARLAAALRKRPGGRIKAGLARWAAARMRALIGLREAPKFAMVRLLGMARQALLAEGARLVGEGTLDRPDDLFLLHVRELEALATGQDRDWTSLVRARQRRQREERARRQVPRLLLSDGRTFYGGEAQPAGGDAVDTAGTLLGTPVSPGMVEGVVRVVRDPRAAQLRPGEILVCPGTDPSWTPLFLTAGGLVMEVGGMMTHGAVVAREYGLPAVVGIHRATERLQTGQRVLVDGSTGRVTVMREA